MAVTAALIAVAVASVVDCWRAHRGTRSTGSPPRRPRRWRPQAPVDAYTLHVAVVALDAAKELATLRVYAVRTCPTTCPNHRPQPVRAGRPGRPAVWDCPRRPRSRRPRHPGTEPAPWNCPPRRADALSLFRHRGVSCWGSWPGIRPDGPWPHAAPGRRPTDLPDAPIPGTGRSHGGTATGGSRLRTRVGRPGLVALRASALLPCARSTRGCSPSYWWAWSLPRPRTPCPPSPSRSCSWGWAASSWASGASGESCAGGPPYVTAVDLLLSGVILVMLAGMLVRVTFHFRERRRAAQMADSPPRARWHAVHRKPNAPEAPIGDRQRPNPSPAHRAGISRLNQPADADNQECSGGRMDQVHPTPQRLSPL